MTEELPDSILATLYDYEEAVKMDEAERLTALSDGRVCLKGEYTAKDAATVAQAYQEYLPFCDEVDEVIDEDDPLTRSDYARRLLIVRDTTPQALLDVGLAQLPVCITEGHLWKILAPDERHGGKHHQHELPLHIAKRIPELLEEPVLIADNPTSPDRLVLVLNEVDQYGYPIVIPMKPNSRGLIAIEETLTNLILSVFGQTNFRNYFGSAVTPGMVVRIDGRAEESLAAKIGEAPFPGLSDVARDHILKRPSSVKLPDDPNR